LNLLHSDLLSYEFNLQASKLLTCIPNIDQTMQYVLVTSLDKSPQTNPIIARIECKAGHGAGRPTQKTVINLFFFSSFHSVLLYWLGKLYLQVVDCRLMKPLTGMVLWLRC